MFADLEARLERPPTSRLTADTRLVADLALDSVASVEMLSELEDHYHVAIPVQILLRVMTLGDVATVVADAIAARGCARTGAPGQDRAHS